VVVIETVSGDEGGISEGAKIAIIVVAALVLLILLIILIIIIIVLCRRHRRKRGKYNSANMFIVLHCP